MVNDLIDEVRRLSTLIDKGVLALRTAAHKAAEAEHHYRQVKAAAWAENVDGTVPERTAQVDGVCADARLSRDYAEAERLAALEALRSRRAQLSALQSVMSADRAEAEVARYGTEVSA